MKRYLTIGGITLAILVVAFLAFMRYTKSHSPTVTTEHKVGDMTVSVKYCQPSKKGRAIFGALVPYGQVWRTGANEATTISFSRKATFGGLPIEAGTYSLFTIPGADKWTVILNKEVGQWGLSHDPAKDYIKAEAVAGKLDAAVEQFTIRFADNAGKTELRLEWDQTSVPVTVE